MDDREAESCLCPDDDFVLMQEALCLWRQLDTLLFASRAPAQPKISKFAPQQGNREELEWRMPRILGDVRGTTELDEFCHHGDEFRWFRKPGLVERITRGGKGPEKQVRETKQLPHVQADGDVDFGDLDNTRPNKH